MPKFTQTAFVRVDDTEQRKELCGWLESIGYRPSRALKMIKYVSYVFVDNGKVSVSENTTYLKRRLHAIDCGDNIEMFCALAALRDDSDYLQWFVCQKDKGDNKSFVQCTVDNITKWYYMRWYYLCRKATPAEIVEHFKEQTQ